MGALIVSPSTALPPKLGSREPSLKQLFPQRSGQSNSTGPSKGEDIPNPYAQWQERGQLKRDEQEGFYIHRTTFQGPQGQKLVRIGFYTVLEIDPEGSLQILPHERTFPRRVDNMVSLYQWRKTQVLPLYLTYSDPENTVQKTFAKYLNSPPTTEFTNENKQLNELWHVTDAETIRQVQSFFQDREILVADGHHRLAASLKYWEGKSDDGRARLVTYLAADESEGSLMGTFHRGIRGMKINLGNTLEALSQQFQVEQLPIDDISKTYEELLKHVKSPAVGPNKPSYILIDSPDSCYRLTAKEPTSSTLSAADQLDVSHFMRTVMPRLGKVEICSLEQDPNLLFEQLKHGHIDLICLLAAPTSEMVWNVAREAMPMPPKTTNFYPKVPGGLVHFELEEGSL